MKEWKTNQSQIKVHTVIQKHQRVCLCAALAVTAHHAELYFGGLVPLKHIKTCLSGRNTSKQHGAHFGLAAELTAVAGRQTVS